LAEIEASEDLHACMWELAAEHKLGELEVALKEHPELHVDWRVGGVSALWHGCYTGRPECVRLLIRYGADVNAVDGHSVSAMQMAAREGSIGCVKLLVENGADVNYRDQNGCISLMRSVYYSHLPITQYLIDHGADLHYRFAEGIYKDYDALFCVMRPQSRCKTPGIVFAVLSGGIDPMRVLIKLEVTVAIRDSHIEEYKLVQAYIDEYHCALTRVLSEHVQVDTRVGRGDNGLYQEPLERVLEYLGMSMNKDQVVNASIDGGNGEEGSVKRALIPGHVLSADRWFGKYTASR
jgi:hypothetical protein